MTFFDRPQFECDVIVHAYEFEVSMIAENNSAPNPYIAQIKTWVDGEQILDALDLALELRYCGV